MIKIFAIVVTYNGEQWIEKCLNSLQNSSISIEIIVIDNKSTDKTTEIIERKFENVRLIKLEKNLGFGQGNNIGLRMALQEKADYVFLLNQDAWIEPDTIQKLVDIQKENNEFGIISPFHYNYHKTEIEYYFSTIINPVDCPCFLNDMFFNKFRNIYEIKFIHAACWLISKECLQKVGGFDPIFPHYCEDNDYVLRANYFHFKIGVSPLCFVMHKGTNKGLTELNENIQLQFNFVILHLKNINYDFPGLFLTNLKKLHDKATSAILYRRFKDFKMSMKLILFSFLKLEEIRFRREICKKIGAYK
jgi:GT2 family glycosyltransferase